MITKFAFYKEVVSKKYSPYYINTKLCIKTIFPSQDTHFSTKWENIQYSVSFWRLPTSESGFVSLYLTFACLSVSLCTFPISSTLDLLPWICKYAN